MEGSKGLPMCGWCTRLDAEEDVILEYMGKLHKDVQAQKAQAVRIVEYQHLFEVPCPYCIVFSLLNYHSSLAAWAPFA